MHVKWLTTAWFKALFHYNWDWVNRERRQWCSRCLVLPENEKRVLFSSDFFSSNVKPCSKHTCVLILVWLCVSVFCKFVLFEVCQVMVSLLYQHSKSFRSACSGLENSEVSGLVWWWIVLFSQCWSSVQPPHPLLCWVWMSVTNNVMVVCEWLLLIVRHI